MKHDSKASYLKDAVPTHQTGLLPLHERALAQWGQSISHVNDIFIAWLEALGAANVGLPDEHLKFHKRKKDVE